MCQRMTINNIVEIVTFESILSKFDRKIFSYLFLILETVILIDVLIDQLHNNQNLH